jgi:phosphoribosylformylglycinamidine cyclo-ligase
MDYKSSGVDIEAGNEVVRRIRQLAHATFTPGVLSEIGSFGGLFALDPERPDGEVLVASADGVGTKLKVAFLAGRHDTVGEDLVNHCVNDILVQGALPLFFLDYLATGRLAPDVAVAIVEGMARACRANGCALLGGETAEMPGFYPPGRYDLAGFCVGVVEEEELVDGRRVREGDRIVAVASSGVHSNGFSLVRRILESCGAGADTTLEGNGTGLIDALLTPTVLYASLVRTLRAASVPLHGMAHITGGGLPENLPRCLPAGLHAVIDPTSWQRPALFRWLQERGEIPEADLWNTFNLGVGFCLVVPREAVGDALGACGASGHRAWELGHVAAGAAGVNPLAGLPY